MEGNNDAIQVLSMLIQFLGQSQPFVLKAGGAISTATINTFKFIGKKGLDGTSRVGSKIYHEHKLKTGYSLKKLMITEGKELGFIRIPEVKIDEVKKSMSKLRCPFSIIEDLNPNDGLVEFAYHVNDSAKVSEMIKSTGIGEIISFEDYINNADAEYIQNEVREMEQSELKKASAPDISETSEPAKFNRNNRELYNKQNQMTITINKETLVMATTSEDILTRIPGSEGKDFVVFNFDDEKIKITDDNQTYVVKLNKNKQYDILDKSGAVTGKISGKTLKENYDKVFRDFNKNKQKVPTAIHSLTPTVKPSTKKI